jgi:hypothetical protein
MGRGNSARLFPDFPAHQEDARMTRKDWALLVIAAAQGKPVSPVQLQKALFLIDRNLSSAQRGGGSRYKFRAYDYGPFDSAVYADADLLQGEGLATISDSGAPHRMYAATLAGMEAARRLRLDLAPDVVDYLDRVVQWVCSLPFSELVRAIYAQYPEMRANSVFRG